MVTFASSVREAETIIENSAPTIMIGTLTFDESRFLTLLPMAQANQIKVVVVDCPYTYLEDSALEPIKKYAKIMGVAAWWDMRRTLATAGMEIAAKEIREIIRWLPNDRLPSEFPEVS